MNSKENEKFPICVISIRIDWKTLATLYRFYSDAGLKVSSKAQLVTASLEDMARNLIAGQLAPGFQSIPEALHELQPLLEAGMNLRTRQSLLANFHIEAKAALKEIESDRLQEIRNNLEDEKTS